MWSCQQASTFRNGLELDARTKKASRRKARCKHLTSRVNSGAWSWLGEETVHPGSRWLDERVRVRTPNGYQRTIRSNTNSQRWFAVVRDIGRVLMSFDVVPRGGEWAAESRVDEVELGPLHRFRFAHSSDQPYFAATDRTDQGQSGIDASQQDGPQVRRSVNWEGVFSAEGAAGGSARCEAANRGSVLRKTRFPGLGSPRTNHVTFAANNFTRTGMVLFGLR